MTPPPDVVDPRTDSGWLDLSRGPGGSLFTSPGWIAAVSETYDFHPSGRIVRDPDGTPIGGFAWIDVDDLRGRRRIALPFSDRAEPILACPGADQDRVWRGLAADAFDGIAFTLRCLDSGSPPPDGRLAVVHEVAWHATDLDIPYEDLHARLRSSVRRNIATAARAGVQVTLDEGPDALHEFHRLHGGLRKSKYRMLAQPRALFENIWKHFAPADGIRTGIAWLDDRAVAAAVYLEWAGTLYYKFGASDPDHLAARPNDALHWAALHHAYDRGLSGFDWGISDLDQPGLVAYKRKWNAREQRVRTLRAGPPAHRTDADAVLGDLTRLLTDPATPDGVTRSAGDLLYRLFC